jgi:hypothetical protein
MQQLGRMAMQMQSQLLMLMPVLAWVLTQLLMLVARPALTLLLLSQLHLLLLLLLLLLLTLVTMAPARILQRQAPS